MKSASSVVLTPRLKTTLAFQSFHPRFEVALICEYDLKVFVKPQTVINYLSSAAITPKTVKKISDALGYPYDLLIKGEYWEGETKMQELERRIKALEEFVYRGEKN